MKNSFLFLYLGPLGASFLLCLLLTPLVRRYARATGRVAVPREDRWHRKETALLGGVAIFVSMAFVWIVGTLAGGWTALGRPYLVVMACASAVFLLGLVDDLVNMDPQHKLAGQIVIASVLLFFGYRLPWTQSNTVNLFLSILWVVGITNAFNLLDNMDGLAAGIAMIAGVFLLLFHFLNPGQSGFSPGKLLILSSYVGSLLGFLVYNFNPASIFMGDGGSLFIGFVLACLTIMQGPAQAPPKGFVHLLSIIAIPILILFIPILDTGFVSFMRKLFRRPISQGGRDHSSHRLVAIGLSEKRAVLVLWGFAAVSGLMALAMGYLASGVSIVLVVCYLLFVLFFWVYLGKVKVYSGESVLRGGGTGRITPLLIEVTYRRRLLEVLLDLVLITVAYYTAYLLRFEGQLGGNFDFFLKSLPVVIACQIFCMYIMGIYRGVWESAGVSDLWGYVKAVTAGTVLAILLILFLYRFVSFSRAVFVIHWFFLLILIALSRFSFRFIDEGLQRGRRGGRRTLIYGAGIGGQMAQRELDTNRNLDLRLVGFIDDNRDLHGRKVKGYPVLGGGEQLEGLLKKHGIEEVIISFRDHGPEKKKELETLLQSKGIEVRVRLMRLVIS
ncbi:MAG: glycosyl transferase [Deltaproteobacteria bacterium]|nr:glycosyl transferase [Deltaproteobacteria bacterium]MBW1922873.1 glycosyl transferase [Deltaproteobacteria bacterium]MBW1950990.1 glycosyl transferase [Deltaproteobacteria bacterium]MBW2009425.1 glycosyl transferase [Deltaproteobacteria bacterium]MBW2349198.1 glycosyl transferase [Deltaproteobacteria bacterium]